MKDHRWLPILLLTIGTIFFVYHRWFFGGALSAPDFTFLYGERLGEFSWLPNAWSEASGNGTGGSVFASLNLNLYLHIGIRFLVFVLGIPWLFASRIMFFWPFIFFGSVGSYYLVMSVQSNSLLGLLGAVVYMTNTYILMIAGGGQVGLMMAYALAPYVFGSFMRKDVRIFAISSVFFIIFDIRYAYILYAAIAFYAMVCIPFSRWGQIIRHFGPAIFWIIGANLFWLIPLLFAPSFGLPEGYGDPGWLTYLSWADFPKTLSLLHPNWPENIFGKTYFMRSEFLILPLLVFLPFLFQSAAKNLEGRRYNFFAALLLVGAFLAKGINHPFGNLYNWLFVHIPLFNGFRDPTKFYLLSSISYTILIPFAVEIISKWLDSQKQKFAKALSSYFMIAFLLFWSGIVLFPFWKGELRGTFENVTIGNEYQKFEKLITARQDFSRILSVPWRQRFLFQSEHHPLMNASDMFKTSDMDIIVQKIEDPAFERSLKSLAVRYVVVPSDSMHEIFLTDRVYDAGLRDRFVATLDKLPYLEKYKEFTDMAVYEYKKSGGHFYYELQNLDFVRQKEARIDAARYTVDIDTSVRPLQLIFSEAYDPAWKLWDGRKYISSRPTPNGLNSFILDTHVTGRVSVWYEKERILFTSYLSSVGALLILSIWRLLRLRGRRTKIISIILVVAAAGLVVAIGRNASASGLLSDKNIWYSPQWQQLTDPFTGVQTRGARFGGSSIHFLLSRTKSLTLVAESANKEMNEQILEVKVNGVSQKIVSPFVGKTLTIPINSSATDHAIPVDIMLHCDSAMVPCDVRITQLIADRGAVVRPVNVVPKKTIAILGDSITTSFSHENYSYLLSDQLGYALHNAAVFGSSVTPVPGWDSGLMRVDEDLIKFKPDIAILFIGTNDLGRGVDFEEFRKNYREVINKIRQGSPLTQVIAIGLLTRKDFSQNEIRAYSNVIEAEAKKAGIYYIDPIRWLDYTDLQDAVHPSKTSQKKIADKMYGELSPLLVK